MRRGHGMTTIILDPSREEMCGGKLPARAAVSVRRELGLYAVPGRLLHDRGMLAIVGLPLVREPPDVDRVGQDLVEVAPAERLAAAAPTRSIDALWDMQAGGIEPTLEGADGAELEIAGKQAPDQARMVLDDVQRPVLDPVAERHYATHPDALLLRCSNLVSDALARDLALELSEGQQHVEGEPPHADRGVEGLGHRDERDAVLIEELDQLGEVGERSGEAIHLVDDDHVDAAGPDLAEQPLQRRSFHRSAREAAIVVAGRQAAPAFMGLALNVGLGCLPLVGERVELLLEPVLGRDTGVDRAAQSSNRLPVHHDARARSRSPKKRGPFQFVPVMARATLDRLS